MDKVKLGTPDLTQENIEKVAALFPDAVTETVGEDGEVRRAIDFDALRDDLSADVVDGSRERYQFTWPGKRAAKLEARTPEDLLFQVLPAFRIPLSASIETFDAAGATCFDVNSGQLVACFDADVSTEAIELIAQRKPLYAVLRDASLADDATASNFEELFRTYSPDTVRRVI